jgi:hypothetical protein
VLPTQRGLAFRWHSLVLRCFFGKRIACGVGSANRAAQASRCDRGPRPLRPCRRVRSEARSTPVAALQADRGATRRFGGRPTDRRNAPAPVTSAQDVLCLSCATRAITVQSALVSLGRCGSPPSGPRPVLHPHLVGRDGPRPVERNNEQAGMVERVDRSMFRSKDSHWAARGRRTARPTLAPIPQPARSAIFAMRRRVPASSRSCSSAAETPSVGTRLSDAGGVRHPRPCLYAA